MNIFQEVFVAACKKQEKENRENSQRIANLTHTNMKNEVKERVTRKSIEYPDKPMKTAKKIKKVPNSKIEIDKKQETVNIKEEKVDVPLTLQLPLPQNEVVQIKKDDENKIYIKEIEKRINEKNVTSLQLTNKIMNSLNDLKEMKSLLRLEEEKRMILKRENMELSKRKEYIDENSNKLNSDITEMMLNNQEELQKQEELWEYRYNELLCEKSVQGM